MAEIGCAGYPGNAHANPEELLGDKAKLAAFQKTIAGSGLEISAFSCHGNPLHPNKALAAEFDKGMRDAVLLAEACGLHQINTFSGCPGDHEGAKYPNWVTCPWPTDFLDILKWQWEEKLIPYWTEFVRFAKAHGVDKIALELHPGFSVYNTESLLKLRAAVGPAIGANFDPSHLIWQGMDPIACIRALGKEGAIFHFHAKDTKIDTYNTAVNGVLDLKPYGDEINRSWVFRSVGYGHGASYWKDIISNLRMVGYDYAISIEHEDSLMSQNEGLRKAVATLQEALITEQPGALWWV
jgi:sugar phosphate isomerase/epimerase